MSGVLEKEKGEGVLNKALQIVSAYDKRLMVVRCVMGDVIACTNFVLPPDISLCVGVIWRI